MTTLKLSWQFHWSLSCPWHLQWIIAWSNSSKILELGSVYHYPSYILSWDSSSHFFLMTSLRYPPCQVVCWTRHHHHEGPRRPPHLLWSHGAAWRNLLLPLYSWACSHGAWSTGRCTLHTIWAPLRRDSGDGGLQDAIHCLSAALWEWWGIC